MDARYLEIAADLRRRIAGEPWPVGTRLPTLRQLQEDYPDVGTSTIQAAVQVLADEGTVATRRGVGSFVSSSPPEGDDDLVEQLRLVRNAATRALRSLQDVSAIRPVRVELSRPENPITEGWGYMQRAYCRDCKEDLGGVTRGWVATEDFYDERFSWGGHDELEHEIVLTYGTSLLEDDQHLAFQRELWWERFARLERSIKELLAGNHEEARRQAQEASRIASENPEINQFGISLSHSGNQPPS